MVSAINSATTTASLSSVAGIEQLIKLSTARQELAVTSYQTRLDDLQVKRGIYSDIQSKLTTVRSAITALRGDDGDGGVLNTFAASVAGDTNALTASVSSSSSAATGTYHITVGALASVDRYASYRFADTAAALNLSGAITLTGAAGRAVSGELYGATPGDDEVRAVSDFSVGSAIRSGQTELDSGQYYVEVQNAGTEADPVWQFRVVDSGGAAVSIDDASTSGADMTSDWQNLSKVAGTTFDTGRGLKIAFESLGSDQSYVAGAKGAGAAAVSYTKSGSDVVIDVAAGDTLEGIRSKINAVAYLDEKAVQATIVDNRLILSTLNTGSDAALQNGVNISGANDILTSGLGFFDTTTTENGITDRHLSVAQNAQLTVNGLAIARSSNTITDVISGVTLNLADVTEQGSSSTLTVKKNNSEVVNKVKSLLTAFNDAVKHLKLKTEPQLDESSESKTPTYTAAPLGSDYSIKELRYGLSADLLKTYSDASSSAYNNLRDLGIDIADDNYTFELADSSALNDALDQDFDSVTALLDYTLGRMDTRLSRYIDDSDSIIASTQDGLDQQMELLRDRKESAQESLTKMQEVYRQQYYQMQAQLLAMQAQYQNTMSMMLGSTNLLNQQS